MNHFGFGSAEEFENGYDLYGEAIILNPSRRDTTIIQYSIFIIHSFQITRQSDKLEFVTPFLFIKVPSSAHNRGAEEGIFVCWN